MGVTLPHLVARSFKIFLADDVWNSGEILSPVTNDRTKVWEQLQQLTALPHFSQCQFLQNTKEVTGQNWPPGEIIALRVKFPVTWQIETLSDPVIQQNLTTAFTPEEAWQQLRHDVPHLFEHPTFNYSGFLKPNRAITAEVLREEIEVTVRFEIKDHGHISFENSRISNMTHGPDIHAHFTRLDPRIPPYAQYADVDHTPHYPETTINFYLQKGIEISDSAANGPGALG
jgi:hypothetical protein